MHLVSLPLSDYIMDWFDNDWDNIKKLLNKHNLDGIEIIMQSIEREFQVPPGLVKGAHLLYWPYWIDFWKGNIKKITEILGGEKNVEVYYGSLDPSILEETYISQIENAERLGAEYVVVHVNNAEPVKVFNKLNIEDDWAVLENTAKFINNVLSKTKTNVKILFENLWSNGLTLINKEKVEKFMNLIMYDNKGIMLDLSHLIITNPNIKSLDEASKYILKIVESLGDIKTKIYGTHINKSLPYEYLEKDYSYLAEKYMNTNDSYEKFNILRGHLRKIDWHLPYNHKSINDILKTLNPEYKVYEVIANSLEEFDKYINIQNKVLNRN